jgi:hypothetical protein
VHCHSLPTRPTYGSLVRYSPSSQPTTATADTFHSLIHALLHALIWSFVSHLGDEVLLDTMLRQHARAMSSLHLHGATSSSVRCPHNDILHGSQPFQPCCLVMKGHSKERAKKVLPIILALLEQSLVVMLHHQKFMCWTVNLAEPPRAPLCSNRSHRIAVVSTQ